MPGALRGGTEGLSWRPMKREASSGRLFLVCLESSSVISHNLYPDHPVRMCAFYW